MTQLNLSKEKQTKNFNVSKKDGVMIILSSPSGAGKTTLVKKLSKKDNFLFQFHTQQDNLRPNETKWKRLFFC